jgi:hypothetical protein
MRDPYFENFLGESGLKKMMCLVTSRKQMSKLKCQMKSKCLNAKTYPATPSATAKGDGEIHNNSDLWNLVIWYLTLI